MQLSTLLSGILACIVAAAAIPLDLVDENNQFTSFRPELARALDEANELIPKMLATMTAAKLADAAALERIRIAFGPNPRLRNIGRNIGILEDGIMRVLKNDIPPRVYGRTSYGSYRTGKDQPLSVRYSRFGEQFYASDTSHQHRASVVLHEAAHALLWAGDDYTRIPGATRMLYAGVPLTNEERKYRVIQGGYVTREAVANLPGHLIAEDELKPVFVYVRDRAYNMDMNADSYSLFAALCEQPDTAQPGASGSSALPWGGRTRRTSLGGPSALPGGYGIPITSGGPSGSSALPGGGRIRRPSLGASSALPGGYSIPIMSGRASALPGGGRIRRTSLGGPSALPGGYGIPIPSGGLPGSSARPGGSGGPTASARPPRPNIFSKFMGKFNKSGQN